METRTASQIFTSVIKGSNFITTNLLGYYIIENGASELTHGKFMNHDIYGVTVVRNDKRSIQEDKSFDSKQDALDYINSL